ncbi:FecCD family ABC transporter permease [Thalassotalea sp. PS06]|uniref:FecCD family ABC transporter permease n=1 Tax=Thalassotalea sp. PS06 TaxID=2594005 RepID=UPI0011631D3C|nr:iron ABC transporter permease [Thalassotalea sp. PS06]QDP00907.1 iron ABC transporter permease [Thalassotalea sp. PS06]
MIKRLSLSINALLILGLLVISIFFSLGMGTQSVGFEAVYACLFEQCKGPFDQQILFDIRLPRIVTGFLAGFGLAMTGALMQNITRNPLADPYLFGIVAGAGLGVTLVSFFAESIALSIPLAAFIGALLAVVLVIGIVFNRHWQRIEFLLLAGVAVSFLLSAITSFTLYISDAFAANRVIFWLMGSLARTDNQAIYWITPVIIIGLVISLLLSRQLDALLISDESARSLGVSVNKVRISILILSAAITAVIVAFCGGIGFVGLMIPHLIRKWVGITTGKLIIFSGLLGGIFLMLVDVVARTALNGQEIPIGVITAAIGSIFFLALMRKE